MDSSIVVGKQSQKTWLKMLLAILSVAFFTFVLDCFFVAVLVLLGLLVHEYGHIIGAKYLGIPSRGIYFLPGLGAVALIDEMPNSRSKECFIALCGPLTGMLFSGLLYILALISPLTSVAIILYNGAFLNAFINLFNLLIPVDPLDGGRILKSISFSLHKFLGFAMLVFSICFSGYLFIRMKWFIGLITGLIGMDTIRREKEMYKTRAKMRIFDIIYAIIAIAASTIIMLNILVESKETSTILKAEQTLLELISIPETIEEDEIEIK